MSFIPDKADLNHCPLCLKKWTMYEEPGNTGKVYFCCTNSWCMISIWIRDAMLGMWHDPASEKIPCLNCGDPMRVFFRSDQYMKCYCPKCKIVIENIQNEDKHNAIMAKEEADGKLQRVKPKKRFKS